MSSQIVIDMNLSPESKFETKILFQITWRAAVVAKRR